MKVEGFGVGGRTITSAEMLLVLLGSKVRGVGVQSLGCRVQGEGCWG